MRAFARGTRPPRARGSRGRGTPPRGDATVPDGPPGSVNSDDGVAKALDNDHDPRAAAQGAADLRAADAGHGDGSSTDEARALADIAAAPARAGSGEGRRGGLLAHRGLVAIIAFFLMTVAGVPVLLANRKAHLKLEGRSAIESGTLTLRVDGGPVFERRLSAPHQDGLAPLFGRNQEGFETFLDIRPGRHEIEAEVVSLGETETTRGSIVLELSPGETRNLRLTIGRTFGRPVQIKVD